VQCKYMESAGPDGGGQAKVSEGAVDESIAVASTSAEAPSSAPAADARLHDFMLWLRYAPRFPMK